MKQVWVAEISMNYPDKWIVVTNITTRDEIGNKYYGDVYYVTDDKKDAFNKLIEIENEDIGETMILEGFDTTPHLGGLYR